MGDIYHDLGGDTGNSDSFQDVYSSLDEVDPQIEVKSVGTAEHIAAALDLADNQFRLEQALRLIRSTPALSEHLRDKVSIKDRSAALLCEADILFRMGRYAESLRVSARALHLDRTSAHAWYNISATLSRIGESKRALQIAERGFAIATSPQSMGILVAKAAALMGCHRYREALDIYIDLQQRLPASPAVWSGSAAVLLRLGREDDALQAAHRAIDLSVPTALRAWTIFGDALRRTGDLAGALVAYERELEHYPSDLQARSGLAQIYAIERQRNRQWFQALRSHLYARSLLFLHWARAFQARSLVQSEIEDIIKVEHLDSILKPGATM
jgi:tetratricopeptide (TPR) repeat protein